MANDRCLISYFLYTINKYIYISNIYIYNTYFVLSFLVNAMVWHFLLMPNRKKKGYTKIQLFPPSLLILSTMQ